MIRVRSNCVKCGKVAWDFVALVKKGREWRYKFIQEPECEDCVWLGKIGVSLPLKQSLRKKEDVFMLTVYKCNQCDWEWVPKIEHPFKCPRCQSQLWSQPKKVQLPRKQFTCLRCEGGHNWMSSRDRPIACPKCHSVCWDRPRKTVSPICRYEEDGVWKGFCYVGNCNHRWLMNENGKNTTCPECGGRGLQARKPVIFDVDGGYEIAL